MGRAIPILVIVGLAIYSFFDVLQTRPQDFRRFTRTTWLVLVLIPIIGAAMWFISGRPRRSRNGYGPPRIINIKGQQRPASPDDDPAFLRKLDEEAWRRKREEARKAEEDDSPPAAEQSGSTDQTVERSEESRAEGEQKKPPRKGPAPGDPGVSPA